MKKRSIALIIGLMGFALLGVMAMQLYFLRQSYQMQSDLFDRSVNEALNTVASTISKHDALNFLNTKANGGNVGQTVWADQDPQKVHLRVNVENNEKESHPKVLSGREKKIALLRDSLRRMILHKKMDDEMTGLMQAGSIDLQLRYEEFTDEFGVVHGRVTPILVRTPVNPSKKHQNCTNTIPSAIPIAILNLASR